MYLKGELTTEDIEKITTGIFKGMREFNNWRWNVPISVSVVALYLVFALSMMWVISLFTKGVIYFVIFGVIYFISFVWVAVVGAELVALHVWMRTKKTLEE